MSRALFRLAALCVTLLALTTGAIAAFAALYPSRAATPGAAPLILVLGGGMHPNGTLSRLSSDRLATGLRLYAEGLAPRLHFSGGGDHPTQTEAGRMVEAALAAGVPPEAVTAENRSKSTLQNAIFTRDMLGPVPPGTLLVTDAFHLPRALASFWWAGMRGLKPVPAEGVDGSPRAVRLRHIGREALAWWFNIARAAAFSALDALGVDREITLPLLAEARP